MKRTIMLAALAGGLLLSGNVMAQSKQKTKSAADKYSFYIDVHHLGVGKVTAQAVAEVHIKDLAIEKKYDVSFIKYWVDERRGNVYCLSSTSDESLITKTHAEAHGLLPDAIYGVTPSQAARARGTNAFYLDAHEFGAGKVTAKQMAAARKKDLAVQDKFGVNFINYWVDEKKGTVLCLSQAADSVSVIKTHRQAHGLMPVWVEKVIQGQ